MTDSSCKQLPRICIACVGKLPVPAVKGGAVETLVQAIIDQNEIQKMFDITLLSVYNKQSKQKANNFRYTKFIWFSTHTVLNKVWWRIYRPVCKCLRRSELFPFQRLQASQWLRKNANQYDLFLAESELEMFIGSGISADKIIYHLHWYGKPTAEKDKTFGWLLGVSEFVNCHWRDTTGRRQEQCLVLKNCIDTKRFQQHLSECEKTEFRKKLGLSSNSKVVTFAGRLVQDKGPLLLLKAIELLPDTNIEVLLIGDTNFGIHEHSDYFDELAKSAENSRHKVVFTGFIPNEDLWRYFEISDCLVSPSICPEAAGMVNIEALANGLPVIAANVGGVSEYLTDEYSTLVSMQDDAVANLSAAIEDKILNHQPPLQQIECGCKEAEQYSFENYYSAFCKAVGFILAKR